MRAPIKKIIQVEVLHSYFVDGKVKDVDFMPSPASQQTLSKVGILVKNLGNGFSLYSSTEKTTIDVIQYLITSLDQEFLEFEFYAIDPTFLNYTELPLKSIKPLLYSNKNEENSPENDVIVLKPESSEILTKPILGTMRFYLKELIDQLQNEVSKFEIRFEARKTQWNYFIISTQTEEGLAIQSQSEINFDGPTETTLPNNGRALKFSSGSNLIQLQERSNLKFDLIKKQNTRDDSKPPKILISGLPLASPNKLNIVEIDGAHLASSEMYVYC